MKAIDRATNHFSNRTPTEIVVPQWADDQGNPLSIYIQPLTVKQRENLIKIERRVGQGLELLVQAVILHARDAQGEPLFTLEDKPALMNRVDPDVILMIGNRMFDQLDLESVKKKSETTGNFDLD